MKLLFIQDTLANAGAEKSHLEILSRFSGNTGVSMVYFYPKHDLKSEYEKAGIRLIFLDVPEPYHFPRAILRLVKLIKSEKPDLLVSSLWRADQITRIASLITRVPLVGTLVNDSYAPLAWQDKQGFRHKIVHWLDWATAGIPVHWIANAQALATSHVKTLGLDRSKISVVYRGRKVPEKLWERDCFPEVLPRSVSPQTEIPASRNERSVRTQTPDNFHFLTYGRLLERKGFQDAIQAFALLVQTYPNCTLTICGDGSYRTELERLARSFGLENSVFLPGHHPNPAALFNSGYLQLPTSNLRLPNFQLPTPDCFLFPSWYEGFSGALVEAMMVGIPIIASDIPMNLEAVRPDREALLFPVRNVSRLLACMKDAIANPHKMAELGQSAHQRAASLFSIEHIAARYEEKLLEISLRQHQK